MAQDFPRQHSKPLCSVSLVQLPIPSQPISAELQSSCPDSGPTTCWLQASVQAVFPSQSSCLSFILLLQVPVRDSQCRPEKKQTVLPILLLLLLSQSRFGSSASMQHIGLWLRKLREENRGKFILIVDKLANKICLHTSF